MKTPSRAVDEAARLAALHSLQVLDTPPEEIFDRLTRLAAAIFDVPTALISLVDSERQWFKSRYGLAATETSRDISFCGHAILQAQPLIVPDATRDPRFADNPLVVGEPHLRFYVGHPLSSVSDHHIGTLCLIDSRPREFDEEQLRMLADLARTAQDLLQFRGLQIESGKLLRGYREEATRFKATFEQSAMGIAHVSPTGEWLRVNRRVCEMLGYAESELRSLTFQDLTHPEDLDKDLDLLRRTIAGEISGYAMEKRYFRKSGQEFWAELTVSLVRSPTGRPDFFVSVVDDISRRKAAEAALIRARDSLQSQVEARTEELALVNRNLQTQMQRLADTAAKRRRSEEQMRLVIDGIPGLISYWDLEERCGYYNKQFAKWLTIDDREALGRTMAELIDPNLYEQANPHIARALAGEAQAFDREVLDGNGSNRHMQISYLPDFDDGEVRGFFAIAVDVTGLKRVQFELQAVNARLERETVTDHLTGLRNRRHFSARGEEAFARMKRFKEPYGLLLLDIDHFKSVNDQFGHDVGDIVLKAFANLLDRNLRSDFEVAMRVGGEEFAVLFYGDVSTRSASQFGERLRQLVAAETIQAVVGPPLRITVSIGGAVFEAGDTTWDDIYRRADSALYAAKAAGRNRVIVAPALTPEVGLQVGVKTDAAHPQPVRRSGGA